jgi:EmrB/QacA subfamily drug resistance transporter
MTHKPQRTPGRTLFVVCVATAMLMLDIAVINSALPRVAVELHSRLSGVAWIIDAYTLALAATVLTAGSVADRYGRRRVFLAGLTVFTISSAVCASATSMIELDLARAVQGIGAAAMFSTSLALLGMAYPDARARGKALAVYGATIGGAFAVGPMVGGALTSWFGWRSVFLLNLPIGVLCIVGALAMAESRDAHPRRTDWTGQLLSGGAMFLVVFALLRGNDVGWTSASTLAEFAAAVLLGVGFIVAELLVNEPMVPLRMFADRSFTGIQISAFAISASYFAMFVYLTFYLQGVLHLSPIQSGLAYVPGTVLMFFTAAATAGLTRFDPRVLLTVGLGLVTIGLVSGLVANEHSSWIALLPAQIIGLIGCGLFNPVMSGLVLRESPAGQEALAAGINDAARQTGIALGVAVLGALVPTGAMVGHAGAHDFVAGLHHALWLAAAIAAAGVVAGWVLIRPASVSDGAGPASAQVMEPRWDERENDDRDHEVVDPALV